MRETHFKKEIRLSGSGGQGLITAGIILARAAVLDKMKVTQTQSYGPESRGGASRADVIISNETFISRKRFILIFYWHLLRKLVTNISKT